MAQKLRPLLFIGPGGLNRLCETPEGNVHTGHGPLLRRPTLDLDQGPADIDAVGARQIDDRLTLSLNELEVS
jgi:hypothetical protein